MAESALPGQKVGRKWLEKKTLSQVPQSPVTEGAGTVGKGPGELALMIRTSQWYKLGGREVHRFGTPRDCDCPTFGPSGLWKATLH